MKFCLITLMGLTLATNSLGQLAEHQSKQIIDTQAQNQAAELIHRGALFLLSAQSKDGGWASETAPGPGITCLVLKALIQEPSVGPKNPAVLRGIEFVKKFIRPDGGVYSAEGVLKNYESCVALSMFSVLERTGQEQTIAAVQGFLKKNQWDENEDKSPDDSWYGGAGYGPHKRPDLSNTQMMLEALRDSGLPQDDPTYKKALIFIQRCQMLGERNDQPFAQGASQGGFIYTCAKSGESKAGQIDVNGRRELRCYGSMTYAGFKSMLYAGLERDDPRVMAALEWIRRYWTLDHNPNMPEKQSLEGVYYYYHVFSRAMAVYGDSIVTDQLGRKHHWRHELVTKLAQLQQSDGSWINQADRWHEGIPALTTAYALLALQAAYPRTLE